jgi:hypothetical protein
MTQQKQSPLGGYRPAADGGPAGVQVLEELRAVQHWSPPRRTPDEAVAFGQWLVAAAQAAADAAKEGGFMGFGAQQVSDREEAMLKQSCGRFRLTSRFARASLRWRTHG